MFSLQQAGGMFALLTVLMLSGCVLSSPQFDEQQWNEEVLRSSVQDLYAVHVNDGVFYNPWMEREEGRFFDFLRWRLSSGRNYTAEEEAYLPEVIPHVLKRIRALPKEQDFLVWLGHATFLIRLSSTYWLTDPMLSERALIPRRRTPAALDKEDLSQLNAPLQVIISHNHYDHLDAATIRSLPVDTTIFVPLGLGKYVSTLHPGKVNELDWWNSVVLPDQQKLTSLPAQHWSRRIWQGINTTLWASYMLESGEVTLYFGGDSGYFIGYREFGELFAKIDYALLPTTAYHPRWFMHYPHMNVEEALAAFIDLKADVFIPTQWGTFRLGDNPPGLPALELQRAIEENELDSERYRVLQPGEILLLDRTLPSN